MKPRDYPRFAQEGPINRATTFATHCSHLIHEVLLSCHGEELRDCHAPLAMISERMTSAKDAMRSKKAVIARSVSDVAISVRYLTKNSQNNPSNS